MGWWGCRGGKHSGEGGARGPRGPGWARGRITGIVLRGVCIDWCCDEV